MKLLHDANEAALYRCNCGCKFWVDAITEENLHFDGRRLIPECPGCGKHKYEDWGRIPILVKPKVQ